MPSAPSRDLVVVPNPHPGRDYEVRCETPEFTCICPMTGQPDFASVRIPSLPAQSIVELKSLKLYLWSYRDEGAFHEDVTNRIADDLVAAIAPRRLQVVTDWLGRRRIHTVVEVNVEGRPVLFAPVSSSSATRLYWVETLGCPKNQVDSDKLEGTLRAE